MLILASQSPRRKELLELAGIPYICDPAGEVEAVPDGMAAEDMPEYLAGRKAEEVSARHPQNIVLAADTLVVFEGETLSAAFEMLSRLSGHLHHVYTGVAINTPEKKIRFTTVTKVEFYELTEEAIRRYIATGEPMDKAGAYGIQGKGSLLVKRIHGDFYTVMGLPIAEVARHLPAEAFAVL